MNDIIKKLTHYLLAPDPEADFRIQHDTERYRKGFGEIKLVLPDGSPVKKARIHLKLRKHAFQFGCNAFMLKCFRNEEENAAFEEEFKRFFNLAVIPFYWSDLEPEDGKVRFSENSPFICRRPPPDVVLSFCEKNQITPKGHPLLW